MGFFSWVTSDTGRSISNSYSRRPTFPVYLLQPDGEPIREDNYEGYGVFGGVDAHALLARWNAPDECVGDDEEDRRVGIFLEDTAVRFPLKFVENPAISYAHALPSRSCLDQGYFYSNEGADSGEGW